MDRVKARGLVAQLVEAQDDYINACNGVEVDNNLGELQDTITNILSQLREHFTPAEINEIYNELNLTRV